jgi:hypothetical protein
VITLSSDSKWLKLEEAIAIVYPTAQSTGLTSVRDISPGIIVALSYVHVTARGTPCILNLQFKHPNTLLPNVGNCLS